jgi:single-strand DNA-binding protein
MFQQLILIGHVGADPELRYTPENIPVCNFRLAVNKRWAAQDGEKKEKTIWFRVTTWRKQAEIANQYLTKGKLVMVVGELDEARAYTSKAGEPAAALEMTANVIRMLDTVGTDDKPELPLFANGANGEQLRLQGMDIPF